MWVKIGGEKLVKGLMGLMCIFCYKPLSTIEFLLICITYIKNKNANKSNTYTL